MTFEEFLYSRHYGKLTAAQFRLYANRLADYLSGQAVSLQSCSYGDMLGFVQKLQREGYTKANINRHLAGLTQYFNYLKKEKRVQHNPVCNLRIRNITQRLPHDLLSRQQLQKIYDSYQNDSITGKRDKIILGLLIYQGLLQGDLLRLEPADINLKAGTIHIRRNSKTNERTLKLEPFQVLPLQEYLQEVRAEIIVIRGKESPYLFIGKGCSMNIKNALREMMKVVTKHNPGLRNQQHIRTSVISHWVKEKNLREAQYMAGHYCVNSTERYKCVDLAGLTETLQKYHPLQ